ncbi:MAG TPA: DUF2231 domain-containing protein [Bradyrhizobium sp.]|nr:DUF2231 domain-containing protein [Bradyrhizobium sp.]
MSNPRSTASIAGHPIHPMLIPFPVAFFVATLVCDFAFWRNGSETVASSAMWLLGAGVVMALLAAVMGLIDVFGERRIFDLTDAWLHAGGNVIIVLIEAGNWYMRYTGGSSKIIPTGLVLSLIAVGGLLFTGWKGWEMVYRHRVGVADETASASQQPRRAA